ncbi:EsaB/YukD family protein [Amycolatopsis rhizosphaerae]|uniref:EsaB/YukD family protein n=1 Tax=Amycolatopsis rhizosphaerae TaxID=2053003 RepID=UPI003CCC5273
MQAVGLVRVAPSASWRKNLPELTACGQVRPAASYPAARPFAARSSGHRWPVRSWQLRRPDGTVFELGRTLGAHQVRDGEILHLALARTTWPESEYDDVADRSPPAPAMRAGCKGHGILAWRGFRPRQSCSAWSRCCARALRGRRQRCGRWVRPPCYWGP